MWFTMLLIHLETKTSHICLLILTSSQCVYFTNAIFLPIHSHPISIHGIISPSPTISHVTEEEDEVTPGYKAPKQVDLKTLQDLDADDEALVKYKAELLGNTTDVLDEGGNNVVLKTMSVSVEGRDDITLDLTGDLTKFKSTPIIIKEGTTYRIKIGFRVQREIVAGLRYFQASYRKGIKVDKSNMMVGSYGPKTEAHEHRSAPDEAPSGVIARGLYTVKSKFTDDDKNIYLEWEWTLQIKKDWA